MIAKAVLVALAAVGVSLVVGGVLVVTRRVWLSGALLTLGGATVVVSASGAPSHPDAAGFGFAAAAALLLPLALTSYPRAAWRHPVDFVALVTITGAGLLTVSQWSDPDAVGALGLVIGLALIAHTWWRIERSTAGDRRALVWMSLGVGVPGLTAGVVVFAFPTTTAAVVGTTLFLLVAPALYVGVARPDVIDVRGLAVHSVVHSLTAAVYVAGFVTAASLLEILSGAVPTVGVLAVTGLLVATTYHPLQSRLRGVVDELLFGHRPDPLGAATIVVGSIGDDPVLALRAIREALVLPYAALIVDGVPVAASGSEVPHTRRLTLALGDRRHGDLVVGLRTGDLRLATGDEHVLQLVAPLLAQTLRARGLAADLQLSREQTVTALEEERRRLRRDLHDGLGPRLTGIAFTSDAVRNSLRSDPDRADALLGSLRAETVTAIDEIRGLVYAMRPPALDELGLIPALRQQAVALRTDHGRPLRVDITADALPAEVTAAVEVAAYRIVMEALTNVARHSGSDTATVRIQADIDALVLTVTDAGAKDATWTTGVGIASMQERAAQLGGTLTAGTGASGGRVRAVLPLVDGEDGDADHLGRLSYPSAAASARRPDLHSGEKNSAPAPSAAP